MSKTYTPIASTPENQAEIVVAVALFAIAGFAFLFLPSAPASTSTRIVALLLFVQLAGAYLGFSTHRVPRMLQSVLPRRTSRVLAGPVVLFATCAAYLGVAGIATAMHLAELAVYLILPAVLVAGEETRPGAFPVRELAAVVVLWLPVEFHRLPVLAAGMPAGYNAIRLVALVEGMYLFIVARPLGGIGYTYLFRARDVLLAVASFAAFAVIAIPLGFAMRFLAWHPQPSVTNFTATPLLIYLVTAVPEEFLFRGLIQNLLARRFGAYPALGVTAVVFGLSHLPDPRYALLAALAGVAYGWVYLRTGKITASAVTHALVDAVWVTLLRL